MGKHKNTNYESRKKEAEKLFASDNVQIKPSPYRIAEMIIYFIALILGFLFLYTSAVSIDFLLPVYAVCLIAGAILRLIDLRKSGKNNPVQYIVPAMILLLGIVLAVLAIIRIMK